MTTNDHDDHDDQHDAGYQSIDDAESDDHERAALIESQLLAGPYRWSHVSTPKLDRAFATAQGGMTCAVKNSVNPHLKSRYADLAAVIDAIREPMSAAGVARYQTPWTGEDGKLYITTRLACEGEWVEADFKVPFEALKGLRAIQSVGNAITYVKRYALTSMAGVASGEDDDGHAGDGGGDDRGSRASASQTRWATAVGAFAELKVKPPAMLAFLGRKTVGQVDDHDHEKLASAYLRLKNRDPEIVAVFEDKG
jgi:hypothetical protein